MSTLTRRQSYMRDYNRRYYQEHRERYLEHARRQRQRKRALINEAKNKPCADCGQSYPPFVMDLDHRKGEKKLFQLGQGMSTHSIDEIQAEIAKCDVVCSNCHRIRTHG